ncbi:MAG: hypothetical protein HKO71_04515 [Pseudomonadales bacterium]|nr:hypothetical protein [Pseudomonadales bacterium]
MATVTANFFALCSLLAGRAGRRLSYLLLGSLILVQLAGCSGSAAPSQSFAYAVQGLYSAELSSNGEQAIVGSINHGGSLWNFLADERIYNWNHKQGEYSQIIASAFSPELNYAITAKPQTMVLWDLNTGQGLTYWTAPSEILDIDLLPNGDFALLGLVDHSAALFDVKNGGVEQIFYHDGRVNSVDYDPASKRVLTGSDDYSARLWDAQSGRELRRWENKDEVQLVVFSPDGSLVFTMAKYDRAAVWSASDGKLVSQLPLYPSAIRRGQEFTAAVFSEDGRYLLTGTANRIIQLWEVASMQQIKKWKMPRRNPASPTSAAVLALAFGSRGNYYTITSDGFAHRLR